MNSNLAEEVADLIYSEFDYFERPLSLKDTILKFAFRLNKETSRLSLTEDVLDRDLQKYISSLLKREQDDRRRGLFCPYEVIVDNDEIVGFSYPRPSDSPLMGRLRQVAPEISKVLDVIRGLEPSAFEHFCSRILDLLDAEETFKTQDSKDEGIDFLGWLCIPETFTSVEFIPSFRKDFRMLVLGQAKRYKPENPIGVSQIRELIGTVAAFHHDQLAPWESRLKVSSFSLMSPILPLMMTTGRISQDARLLARKCGVIARDGAEIALFICLEGIGMDEVEQDGSSRLKFNHEKFMDWLTKRNPET